MITLTKDNSIFQPRDAWDKLSMEEQATMMKVAVRNGIFDLGTIRQKYNEFAEGGDTSDEEELKAASLNEARKMGALVGVAPFVRQKNYIGGTKQEARNKYWQTDQEMYMLTDSVARTYGINPDLLRYRLDTEGYTDARVKEINQDYRNNTNKTLLGEKLFNSDAMPYVAGDEFGLDDTATYINNGDVQLINENWGDGEFLNEKNRWTNMAIGHKYSDNFGIMAATLKYFRNLAKQDFPYASDADLDRYAAAYYNRGRKGGKDWVKHGAKGYTIKELGGPLVEAAMNEYKNGGGIYIKPSHRGRLTELKKRTGKSEAELYNDGNPAHKKMVVFARNSRKWKHGLGGPLVENLFEEAGKMDVSPYRYVQDINKDGTLGDTWSKVNNDEMGRAFQRLIVTPSGNIKAFVPAKIDNSEEGIRQREKFLSYRDEKGNLKGEPGLEIVSPEFDAITLVPLANSIRKNIIQKGLSYKPVLASGSGTNFTSEKSINLDVMPKSKKEAGIKRMQNFIHSQEFQTRLEKAGLTKDKDYIVNLIERRMQGENMPAWEADIIRGKDAYKGLSETASYMGDYGITVKRGLTPEEFVRKLDHEIAHFTTKNTFPGFWKDLYHSAIDLKFPNLKLQKLMRYNNKVATTKNWKDYYFEKYKNLTKDEILKLKEEISEVKNRFKYLSNGQERRARAYAMYQEAQKRGITTDELVDMYNMEGEILGEAPGELQDLNVVYDIDNLKKYLNGFASTAIPLSITASMYNNE